LPNSYPIDFDDGNRALAQDLSDRRDLAGALRDLAPPRPVLVLVGGANSLDADVAGRVFAMFRESLVPLIERLGAAIVDGGTDSGVMALIGRARADTGASFPLIGVAARGTVRLPDDPPLGDHGSTRLDPCHTRFLLVPGDRWGDESPWLVATASALAQDAPSGTLSIGGGRVTKLDLKQSLQAGRPILLLAGSGGATDALAQSLRTGNAESPDVDERLSALLRITELDDAPTDIGQLLGELRPR